jgi:flagellar motility protein MotE (MotC chaperone)
MIRKLQSPIVAAVAGVIAYALATWLFLNPSKAVQAEMESRTIQHGTTPPKPVPSWEFQNPELEQMLAEVKAEREALNTRRQELAELEARLKSEWQEIGVVTQRVARLQAEVEKTFVSVKRDEAVNLKKLARMYASMKPDSAAKIIFEMDDSQVVRILAMMKDTEAAAIMQTQAKQDKAELKRVATLSDQLRLVRAPNATEEE